MPLEGEGKGSLGKKAGTFLLQTPTGRSSMGPGCLGEQQLMFIRDQYPMSDLGGLAP